MTTRIRTTSIYDFISRIKSTLNSDLFQELNKENKAVVEQINILLINIDTALNTINTQWVTVKTIERIESIQCIWYNLDKLESEGVTDDFKKKYKETLARTKDFFTYFTISNLV